MGKDTKQKHHYYRGICCDECEALWGQFSRNLRELLNNKSTKPKQAGLHLMNSNFTEEDVHFMIKFSITNEAYLTDNGASLKITSRQNLNAKKFVNSILQDYFTNSYLRI